MIDCTVFRLEVGTMGYKFILMIMIMILTIERINDN